MGPTLQLRHRALRPLIILHLRLHLVLPSQNKTSENLHCPSLVGFVWIKRVENHLVSVIVLTTFDLQEQVGAGGVADEAIRRDAPAGGLFARLR